MRSDKWLAEIWVGRLWDKIEYCLMIAGNHEAKGHGDLAASYLDAAVTAESRATAICVEYGMDW